MSKHKIINQGIDLMHKMGWLSACGPPIRCVVNINTNTSYPERENDLSAKCICGTSYKKEKKEAVSTCPRALQELHEFNDLANHLLLEVEKLRNTIRYLSSKRDL